MDSAYRNLHNALPQELADLFEYGDELGSRNGKCKELTAHTVTLYNPVERVQVLPGRNANIFAQIAETMWLLAGRSDIEWLTYYLPRAPQFSDDGKTWRAAYGPRLRAWPSTIGTSKLDQLDHCRQLLIEDRGTRQAVLGIWDPARDLNMASLDIPCNDTIQFLERDGRLDMHVFARSNDVWWGWSGINTFAWSVLLEAMAQWTSTQPGHLVTFAGSWHLYERHWTVAERIANTARGERIPSVYAQPNTVVPCLPWNTPFEDLGHTLQQFFILEGQSRKRKNIAPDVSKLDNPFLQTCLLLLNLYNAVRQERSSTYTKHLLFDLPHCDLALAVEEWFGRSYISTKKGSL
jgi:thymidylate synthase